MKKSSIVGNWHGLVHCEFCSIHQAALFSSIPIESLAGMHLPIDNIQFDTGASIYNVGGEGGAVFTVRSGLVKLARFLPNGSYRIVRLARHGSVLGLEALLGSPYEHTATALSPTFTCRIPRDTVYELANAYPALYQQIMQRFCDAVHQADEWLTLLSTGSIRARIARLFLYLEDKPHESLCTLLGREDLAAILGTTPETTSRIIADMKRAGAIHHLGLNRFRYDTKALHAIAQQQ
ncbi:transcriptional regulator, Crp/Fnr family [invertebrate metagenome]|uniref:Transcriptional regulator, Crp/Fnr family n=1 Tax=invertebrate metagenome TaxID=1711999 RepID=A0A484H6M0_9ZZZZ